MATSPLSSVSPTISQKPSEYAGSRQSNLTLGDKREFGWASCGIEADDSQVSLAMEELAKQGNYSLKEYKDKLKNNNIDYDKFREQLKN